MAVDLSNLAAAQVATESDVEQKVIWPLLTAVEWLNIPESSIRTKSYLPLTTIDKGSGRKIGYYPDYAVWLEGLPVLIVEAKTPLENAIEGSREAELYAHELNKAYPSGINPPSLVLSTNGKVAIFGPWDGKPAGSLQIQDLQIGTSAHHELKEYLGFPILAKAATTARSRFRPAQAFRPIDSIGGDARSSDESDTTPLLPIWCH
jgi:type I site-specific restriction endonuclease